jgi:hypothetical protein
MSSLFRKNKYGDPANTLASQRGCSARKGRTMKIKKVFFTKSLKTILFLAVWCVCSLNARAQSSGDFGTGNALHWEFNSNTLTISGTGDMPDVYPTPWNAYIASITQVDIGSGVTKIGFAAFAHCENLVFVTIPSTVTAIGVDAFKRTGITAFTIPANVTSIQGNPFPECRNLSAVDVDAGNTNYTSVDGVLFDQAMTTLITYPAGKTTANYTIPSGVTDIYIQAFYDAQFTSVTIPASVTNIGDLAFVQCWNLASYTVNTGNTAYSSIDGVLFANGATVLLAYPKGKAGSSYTVPGTVTRIGAAAFNNCNLTSVSLPSTLASIDLVAFENCNSLTSITSLAVTPPSLGTDVFYNIASNCTLTVPAGSVSAYSAWSSYFSSITGSGGSSAQTWNCGPGGSSSVIATLSNDTLTISGTGDMENYSSSSLIPWDSYKSSITAAVIEYGVTDIAFAAFAGCFNLTSVTISNSVTNIRFRAFADCSSLTSVTIPNSVTGGVDNSVFSKCRNLTDIIVEPGNISYSSEDGVLFNYGKTVLIAYPAGKTGAYTIPDGVAGIENEAFSFCSGLTSVTIPNSVTSIGNYAFMDCSSLTSVTSLAATPPSLGTDALTA